MDVRADAFQTPTRQVSQTGPSAKRPSLTESPATANLSYDRTFDVSTDAQPQTIEDCMDLQYATSQEAIAHTVHQSVQPPQEQQAQEAWLALKRTQLQAMVLHADTMEHGHS
eukprot:m.10039 g.10039  ORF g.10039 m.10039 type:complete len:112 (+) comp5518_c0_seq2:171-506(+)